nr:spore germination protein [Oceanobacillus profundus]
MLPLYWLHSSEDYYQRADIGSMLRLLRYLGFFNINSTNTRPSFFRCFNHSP